MPTLVRILGGLAAIRIGIGLAVFLSGNVVLDGRSPIPIWAYALIGASFATVGSGLILANRRDTRAVWLGAVLLLLAVPLTQILVDRPWSEFLTNVARVRPDTFLPWALWLFVEIFPSPISARSSRIVRVVQVAAGIFGAITFGANLSRVVWPLARPVDWRLPLVMVRGGGSVYWITTYLACLAALGVLLVRLRGSALSDRFRLKVFISGLAIGLAPIFVEVLAEEAWPSYKAFARQPWAEAWIGFLIFAPLAVVPFATAYSVLYDRVVDVRLVMRAAAQYALARATIIGATAIPIAALGVHLFQNRSESLVALFGGARPLGLIAAAVTGAAALRMRRSWLTSLDRRYFREHRDPLELVTQMTASNWLTEDADTITARLQRQLADALHADVEVLVLDAAGETLRGGGDGGALERRGTLATLLKAAPHPMDVNGIAQPILSRLPDRERTWLTSRCPALLVPLRTASTDLIGVLALGAKRSELPYSDAERLALSALAATVALALDNERLRRTAPSDAAPAAAICESCLRVRASTASRCSCGGGLMEAAAPLVLRGTYQFERRLGVGGMGVVYLARDMSLQRSVAIKTLPALAGRHQERLRSEALAMASLVDPNLAVIYGLESWRGMPFLIEEYLEGGTLSDRLGTAMPIEDSLDLGLTLAAALSRMHRAGIIHCDIKPSNIGFSSAGIPKLIDFGLAQMLRAAGDTETVDVDDIGVPTHTSQVTRHGAFGTPVYMSPEALQANAPTPQFDLWSLTIVLFETIAGQRPFSGRDFGQLSTAIQSSVRPDIRAFRVGCSLRLHEFFARSLSTNRAERPATADAMMHTLRVLRDELR